MHLHRHEAPPVPPPRIIKPGEVSNLPYVSLKTLFKGRDEFLDTLHKALETKEVAIHGMGGVGKTRAAIEYALRHQREFTALLFVSADSPEDLQRSLAQLCGPHVLNLPEREATDQNAQYIAVLRWLAMNPGWLLILDNADSMAAAGAVEAMLKHFGNGRAIITTRLADWSGQIAALELDLLNEDAATEFLLERTADRRVGFVDDSAKARDLARLLGGLALALEQAAAYIREQRLSFVDYIQRWQSVPADAIEWHDAVKMQYPKSLAVTYEASVVQLSSGAQELFTILAWLAPDSIPFSTLESLKISGDTRACCMDLERFHLVRFREDGKSFAVHRLVQEITRQKQRHLSPPPALSMAAKWIDELFIGEPTDVRSWPVLEPLVSHAHSVANFADGHDIADPTARLMNQIGIYFHTRALHGVAEPLLRRALHMDEAAFGPQHPTVAIRLNNLAQLLQATNRLAEAEPLLRRALDIFENTFGSQHPNVAVQLNNLAQLLQATNRLAEVEPLMRRALDMAEAAFGPQHPTVAIRLNNLAQLLQATNRLAEAEPLFLRVIAILENKGGEPLPNFAGALNNLATLLQATNRLAEAEPLMRRALDIDQAAFGPQHPTVAIDLNNLATLLKATNRLAEAEPLMRRALDIDEASLGPQHPTVATRLNNLAQLLQATNRLAEAEPLVRRALAMDEAAFGPKHPTVANRLNNLAQLLKATNRLTEAEPLMRRTLAIDEASLGPQHPTVATRLNNLARLLQDTNRLAEAEPLMSSALEILVNFSRDTGYAHPHLQLVTKNYGNLLVEMGDSEAQAQEKIVQILEPIRLK